jgi:poly(A) polymerase
VRDLLLEREPKDFDIGTNARPREIRRLFRNSRIIGRRFRLVHVFFKGETVEVSTFRARLTTPDDPDDWDDEENGGEEETDFDGEEQPPEAIDVYGTPLEDAHRRDITVNALFYNIADFSVIDHVGGLEDLEAGLIRAVGPPALRFENDPVRMMRALEYSVRLGFEIEPVTRDAIARCAEYITEATPARLTYELLETLGSGHAAGICDAWNHHGILKHTFPEAVAGGDTTIQLLKGLDRRVSTGKPIAEASLLGVIFLPRFAEIISGMTEDGAKVDNVKLLTGLREMLEPTCARMRISNHTMHLIHNGLFTISKLRRRPERGRQVMKLVRQECFDVTWDLYSIGVANGLFSRESFDTWARAFTQAQKASPGMEPKLMLELSPKKRRRRRPRRRRRNE